MSHQNITFYPNKNTHIRLTLTEPMALFANGHPVKVIADKLDKAIPTINNQLVSARHYYHAANTTQAVAIAIAMGDIKFKFLTSYTTTLRFSALSFALLAAVVCVQDTPFVTDVDHSVIRHTRTTRGHKHGRNTKRKETLDPLFT